MQSVCIISTMFTSTVKTVGMKNTEHMRLKAFTLINCQEGVREDSFCYSNLNVNSAAVSHLLCAACQ